MSQIQTLPEAPLQMTQHAMLVIWGIFACRIGLVKAVAAVKLKQKKRDHRPQTKVLEFLVAILGGLPHLQAISRSAHPLDQDAVVAEAWGQDARADYSGVSRTLSRLTGEEVADLAATLDSISQPYIDREVALALETAGALVYDADLTGRPVSSTSSSYPNTAFGHMGDAIELGYQAALVSLHSPTYGRLWLANELHPGDTVSMTRTQALVIAAEKRTNRRPRRRTDLLGQRLVALQAELQVWDDAVEDSFQRHRQAQQKLHDAQLLLREWEQEVRTLTAIYQKENRSQTAHCLLTRAQHKVAAYTKRVPHCEKAFGVAERWLARHEASYAAMQAEVDQLQARYQQLQADNAANSNPIRATFRLDGGFTRHNNLYWLIEMGYEVYTRGRFPKVRHALSATVTDATDWHRVGGNANMTAWCNTTVAGYFAYPLDVALLHYHTGETVQRTMLLHYGQTGVVANLDGWFHTYNDRQTIEAGIKEGKTSSRCTI